MTVNLRSNISNGQNNKATSLLSKTDYLSKNQITINNPKQTHFSVEGVQSYAPQEITALKLRQDKTQPPKDGQYVQLKTVLLSNQIINWPEDSTKINDRKRPQTSKVAQKQPAKFFKVQQPSDQPLNKYLQQRKQQRINKKNAVSTNNQAIVKYEKNVAKKQALDYKLQKMKKMYKQHFKDTAIGEKGGYRQAEEEDSISVDIGLAQNTMGAQHKRGAFTKQGRDKASTKNNTVTHNQKKQKAARDSCSDPDFSDMGEPDQQQVSNDKRSIFSENVSLMGKTGPTAKNKKNIDNPLLIGLDLVNNTSSYSQKLGTAIHEMFR